MLLAPHTPAAAFQDVQQSPLAEAEFAAEQIGWQGTVVIQSEGREDSFAIGPDGCVWNFVRLQGKEPQLLPTGLKASSFAAARDEQGRLVLFAANGMQLQASVQQPDVGKSLQNHWQTQASSLWSKPMCLHVPCVPHAVSIARVSCEGIGAYLHVGALLLCQRERMAEHFELAVSRWPQDGVQLQHVRSSHHAWANSWHELLRELRRLADASQQTCAMA
jgi:hypothetical protein